MNLSQMNSAVFVKDIFVNQSDLFHEIQSVGNPLKHLQKTLTLPKIY